MKLNKFIRELQALKNLHGGDIEVKVWDSYEEQPFDVIYVFYEKENVVYVKS